MVPELIEVEMYRRAAERACGRPIAGVIADDGWFLKGRTTAAALASELTGAVFTRVDRVGKLLIARTGSGTSLGFRFGMTGRLIVDGVAPIDQLLYSSDRDLSTWDRFQIRFVDGGTLVVRDPRRLGGVELEPDASKLGVDATRITVRHLEAALRSGASLKSVLLDQHKIAGIGNLLADEMLWQAGLRPQRSARSLSSGDVRSLHAGIGRTLRLLTRRGGSHTGDFMDHRRHGALCPRDGGPIRHESVAGRSTWWCEHHQV